MLARSERHDVTPAQAPRGRTGAPASPLADPLDRRLQAIGSPVAFEAGRTILIGDEPADHLYLVASGIVRKSKILADGRRHIVDFLGRGEVFGLSETPVFSYLVEAETDATLVKVARATLARTIAKDPTLGPLMMTLAERRVAKYERKLVAMGCLCSVERVAHFLAWLADTVTLTAPRPACSAPRPGAAAGERMVEIPMTRREIADYLGLTLETVCRAFTRLRELGLVVMPTHGTFTIPDRAALDAFILAERG